MASAYCQLVARDLALDGMSRRCLRCGTDTAGAPKRLGSIFPMDYVENRPTGLGRTAPRSFDLKRLNSEGWRPGRLWHSFPSCDMARGFCREHDER